MNQSDELQLLHRYLRATRRRCEFLGEDLAQTLEALMAKAFPDYRLNCRFVPVRSDSRRCEIRTIGASLFVVIDIDLSDRLMELDLIAQIPRADSDWIFTFATVLMSDEFRKRRDFRRYRYSVLKASGDRKTLHTLSMLPKDGLPFHAAIVPVLLHEVAHAAYRQRAAFVDDFRQMAQAALDKFADGAAMQAETGKPAVAAGRTIGIRFEDYDQQRLKEQLHAYAATIRNNSELLEELTCDFIAALAFVNSEAGIDCFKNLAPKTMPLSARQLGDIFYLAIKTSRYLQFLLGLQQFGVNATEGKDTLSRSLIEITARTNGLTHLLTSIFNVQVDAIAFAEKPDFGKPLTNIQIKELFGKSIARLMQIQHDQLLKPFDLLMELFLAPEAFSQDESELVLTYGEPVPESFDAVDLLRARLPL